jgi:hypothetical protein
MSQIDWSKAPEGYPVWVESHFESDPSDWHKRIDGGYQDRKKGIWYDWQVEANECTVHEMKQEWTGEGLPPVGTVCQLKNVESGSEWREVAENGSKVTIIAHYMNAGTPLAAFTVGVIGESFTVDSATESFFEPIRTPEQIAAEERGRSVEQMVADLRLLIVGGKEFSVCEALYDAGYRKQAEK